MANETRALLRRRPSQPSRAELSFEPFVKVAGMLMDPQVDDKKVLEMIRGNAFQDISLEDVDFFVPQIW